MAYRNEKSTEGQPLTIKEKARLLILNYLSENDNPFQKWTWLSTTLLGYKSDHQLYEMFTPNERRDIEVEALAERRKQYSRFIASVDKALINSALKGDNKSAKLVFQRFENWSESITQKQETEVKLTIEMDDEVRDLLGQD